MNENQTNGPVGYLQACDICQEYQHLVGARYDEAVPGKGAIACIVSAPYDEGPRWQFVQFYLECNDPQKALRFYKGMAFVPLVLSIPILRKKTVYHQDLREYLRTHDIPFRVMRHVQVNSQVDTSVGNYASQ